MNKSSKSKRSILLEAFNSNDQDNTDRSSEKEQDSENMDLNRRRAKKLKLDFDFHGSKDKLQIIEDLCKNECIDIKQVAYIGDDINCYELLSNVGIAACPSNAVDKIKNIPGIIHLNKMGGYGVFREFIDYLIE